MEKINARRRRIYKLRIEIASDSLERDESLMKWGASGSKKDENLERRIETLSNNLDEVCLALSRELKR